MITPQRTQLTLATVRRLGLCCPDMRSPANREACVVDIARFDALARRLGTSPSRRNVIAALTGGMLAIVPLWRYSDDTAARKKHKEK
jgi:hypothetical protein